MDDSAESSDADGDDISENTGEKETNSYSQRGTSSIELSKSRKRKLETRKDTKFVESWLDVKEFKEWLLKRKGKDGKAKPYCKICQLEINSTKTGIQRHMESEKHRRKTESAKGSQSISTLFKPQ